MTERDASGALARVLAIAELLSKHLNGPTAHRLADALAGAPLLDDLSGLDEADADWVTSAKSKVTEGRIEHWRRELDAMTERRIRVLTVASPEYPSNVAAVHDRPPLLFVDGQLDHDADRRAVAVVGTRAANESGRVLAEALSRELAGEDVVVVSGLAAGIDAAAHRGAIEGGGRTIAVFGTGIHRLYPADHARLAGKVREHGACVSQFWPDQGPTRWTFPIRNVVTSAFSVATVVVEASETSGARLQAERALAHGKRVILTQQLVDSGRPWARDMLERPAVTVADGVDDILAALEYELMSPAEPLELVT